MQAKQLWCKQFFAKNLTLYEVEKRVGQQLVQDDQFIREWLDDLPEFAEGEKQLRSPGEG